MAILIGRFEKFLIKWIFVPILKWMNAIPSHIAFILDGNRRHAKKKGLSSKFEGHISGYVNVENILQLCHRDLGIKMVTLYVFSMENFKRSPEEVQMLMDLLGEKLEFLSTQSKFIKENDVAIRVLGELEYLPPSIRAKACQAMLNTKDNESFVINICAPYTSRDELAHIIKDLTEGRIPITPKNIDLLLYTTNLHLDILVRTSGEQRLSEFLTWQVCSKFCMISWVRAYWPDFNFWHLFIILVKFFFFDSRCSGANDFVKCKSILMDDVDDDVVEDAERGGTYDDRLSQIRNKRWEMIEKWAKDPNYHKIEIKE